MLDALNDCGFASDAVCASRLLKYWETWSVTDWGAGGVVVVLIVRVAKVSRFGELVRTRRLLCFTSFCWYGVYHRDREGVWWGE